MAPPLTRSEALKRAAANAPINKKKPKRPKINRISLDTLSDKQKAFLITPIPGQKCKSQNGCDGDAIKNNRGFCLTHSDVFLPRVGETCSQVLGTEFLPGGGVNSLCCCNKKKCREIGYPNKGWFRFPTDADQASQWCAALKADPETTKDILENPGDHKHRLAYWHFLEEHRYRNRDGKWEILRSLEPWKDNENKVWKGTVPIASLDAFISSVKNDRKAPKLRLPPQEASAPTKNIPPRNNEPTRTTDDQRDRKASYTSRRARRSLQDKRL